MPICYKLHAFRFLTAYFLWMLKGVKKKEKKKISKHFSLRTQETMLWSKSHCSDEFLSCPVALCIKTQLLKLPLTTINGNDFALSVLLSPHCSGGTTGFRFTLINCFQVLWKRRKINQAEYRDCSARRLPLNTISKCERLHLKLIATPRLFRKVWQEKLQQGGKQNNNREREKDLISFWEKALITSTLEVNITLAALTPLCLRLQQFQWYFGYQHKRGDVSLSWSLVFCFASFSGCRNWRKERGNLKVTQLLCGSAGSRGHVSHISISYTTHSMQSTTGKSCSWFSCLKLSMEQDKKHNLFGQQGISHQ